jgi:DNA repair protein RecN (Recombination protein N)
MIKTLSIRNYGIIRAHDINFSTGLHVVTGETGAGKSLILNALGLLIGERYDGHPALDPNQKCIIEAEFVNEHPDLLEWLDEQGFERDAPLILRRELSAPVRTRCFIQDCPASLTQLRDISYWLIDICGQHDARELKSARIHLEYVDEFAQCRDLALQYKNAYLNWKRIDRKLGELTEKTEQAGRDYALNQFYLNEIQSMDIKGPDELAELEMQQRLIEQSKAIQESLQQASWELDGQDQGLIGRVNMLQKQIRPYCDLSVEARDIYECYEQATAALKEAAIQAGRWFDSFSLDHQNTQPIVDRIDKLNQLLSKHQARDLAGLLQKKMEMESRSTLADQDLQFLEELKKQSQQAHENAHHLAGDLHQKRTEAAPQLEMLMQKLMPSAGFTHARLELLISQSGDLMADTSGYNQVEFKFSANPGQAMSSLQKVASGGELSRLTLCLRTACRPCNDSSAIVFDEIDTGISGQTAMGIGKLLREMAVSQQQIILITHLPQIAAAANRHFRVTKSSTVHQTTSVIDDLDTETRIQVLAGMMAGSEAGEPARQQAEALIKHYSTQTI